MGEKERREREREGESKGEIGCLGEGLESRYVPRKSMPQFLQRTMLLTRAPMPLGPRWTEGYTGAAEHSMEDYYGRKGKMCTRL